jgi:hypothetical protein
VPKLSPRRSVRQPWWKLWGGHKYQHLWSSLEHLKFQFSIFTVFILYLQLLTFVIFVAISWSLSVTLFETKLFVNYLWTQSYIYGWVRASCELFWLIIVEILVYFWLFVMILAKIMVFILFCGYFQFSLFAIKSICRLFVYEASLHFRAITRNVHAYLTENVHLKKKKKKKTFIWFCNTMIGTNGLSTAFA